MLTYFASLKKQQQHKNLYVSKEDYKLKKILNITAWKNENEINVNENNSV